MKLLEWKEVTISFPDKSQPALRQFSLSVEKGETLAIVGESGSGKSTAALAVLKLLPPAAKVEGEICWQGENVFHFSEERLRHFRGGEVSIVFQNPMTSLNPAYTIGFQLREALKLHTNLRGGELEDRACQLLEEVALPEPKRRLKQYPHELSGGQRQRVMIAMAMASRPALLIADEPTTALDVTVQAEILQLFRKLQRESDCAFVLISHDLAVVWQLAQKVAVLYGGLLLEVGSREQVLEHPQHPYTQGLLASHPRLSQLPKTFLQALPEGRPVPTGCPFQNRCALRRDECSHLPEWREVEPGHWVRCLVQKEGESLGGGP